MAEVPSRYWSEIRGRMGRLPVWLPQTVIELGDVGVLTPERWTKLTTLTELGIPFQPSPSSEAGDIRHTSADVSNAGVGAAVDPSSAVPGVDLAAEVVFHFANEGSCVFEADEVRLTRIDNLEQVQNAILRRYKDPDADPKWERSWTFVSEVASGSNCRIIVAHTAGAQVAFAASALAEGLGGASLNHRMSRRHGVVDIYQSTARHSVLWSGRYVKDFLFRRARFDDRGIGLGSALPSDVDSGASVSPPTVLEIVSPDDTSGWPF